LRDKSRPDVETLQRLADALGVELTALLDGEPPAAGRRAVKLHKGNRQKLASAGFLPVLGKSARAPCNLRPRVVYCSRQENICPLYAGNFHQNKSEGTS